ncbi:hypothetical protein TWF481_002317 [Arthrobotrys musiformis]|uniref:HMA domain-containing protein n=1 Tax=Arthrobotrys musiformis TaxID=47236 RepID=A0AAV9VU18_9PEZI
MSDQKQESPKGSREDNSNNAPPIGCCVDCGCGRSACDENCVRTLALLKCRATCDEPKQQQTAPAKKPANVADKCCATARTNVDACGNKTLEVNHLEERSVRTDIQSGGADAVIRKNACTDQPGIPTGSGIKKKGGCCAKKAPEGGCGSEISESCCPSKQGTGNAEGDVSTARAEEAQCAKKRDGGSTSQQDGCCSKKGDSSAGKQDGCCPGKADPPAKKEGGCCSGKVGSSAGKKGSCCSGKVDSSAGKQGGCCSGRADFPAKKQDDCCSGKVDSSAKKQGGCCSKKEDSSAGKKDSCCPGKVDSSAKKQDSCCPGKADSPAKKQDDCCSGKVDSPAKKQDGCCSKKEDSSAGKQDNHGTKQKPGCCTTNKSKSTTPSIPEPESQSTMKEACTDHLQQAMNEYLSLIQKGICICCSILDRLDTCCGRPVPNKQVSEGTSTTIEESSPPAVAQQPSDRRTARECEKSCCGKPATDLGNINNAKALSGCPSDDLEISPVLESKGSNSAIRTGETDIENAAARQRILLSVAGMTCTGCSRKVTNVLNGVNGVSSINVTFVTGVAEFDLDLAVSNLQQVIPRIEKETGFKFSQIVSNHQTLDLQVDPAVAKTVFEQLRSAAVESVERVGKSTYRVNYDPAVIGARTLLSSIKGASLAPPGNDANLVNGRRRLIRTAWITGVAMALTIPILALNWSNNPVPYSKRSIVSLVLATFVQALAIPEFYAGAITSLVYSRVIEMDMLVVISITAAYAYSVVAFALTHAGYVLETGEFFETSSLLIALVLLGRLIAAIAKVRAISAVSLRSLQAEKALLVVPSSGTVEIDARLLQLGDSFVVPAHSRIVTDGLVIDGKSSIDESMITGENVPVPKAIGDEVIAGTINCSSPLTISMTRLPGKNSITDIANLVENALAAKPRIQDLADTVAGYFIPVVICIALTVFGIWMAVALKVRGENGGGAVGVAITYSIAVLAVSCPCALGLAVPMVLVIAGGVAARSGVIIKQADVIERGHKVTDVVFDKTGTITKGDLTVVHEQLFPHLDASDVLSIAKPLTKENQHPVSMAVATHLQQHSIVFAKLENVESIPGAGIQCEWQGSIIKAGNPYWLNIEDHPEVSTLIEQGMSLFCITSDSILVAAFGLKANIREEAKQVIADLQRRQIKCHILSGDGPRVVEDVATAVGIPLTNTASRHSPAQKQHYIKELMSSGRTVLFCGDGTNDAVAVAQANVGVQIGTTSDITRATADVVLLGGLDGILILLDISKRSSRRIIFNFAWSAIYNVFAILLAAGAFVKARIPPAYAGLGEVVSVVPVIVAALTLSMTKRTN